MTITAAATGTPLSKPDASLRFVDEEGKLTQHAVQLLSQWRDFIVGTNRVIPCNASGTNTLTVTPLDSGPLIEKYVDFEMFGFVAENSSSGAVTATVVPRKGALATLKVYASDGAVQATSGDIIAGSFYWLVYCDHLDTAAGGFVLK